MGLCGGQLYFFGLLSRSRPPCIFSMMRGIVGHVAPSAARCQVFIGIVSDVVIKVHDGQHDPGSKFPAGPAPIIGTVVGFLTALFRKRRLVWSFAEHTTVTITLQDAGPDTGVPVRRIIAVKGSHRSWLVCFLLVVVTETAASVSMDALIRQSMSPTLKRRMPLVWPGLTMLDVRIKPSFA